MSLPRVRGIDVVAKRLTGPTSIKGEKNYIFKKDVIIGGDLHCNNIVGGSIQPNIVVRGHSCINTVGWRDLDNTKFTVATANPTDPPTEFDYCLTLTQVSATYNTKILSYFEFSEPQDLSYLDYIGFFYRGADGSNTYPYDALQICFWSTNVSELITTGTDVAVDVYPFVNTGWTETATPSWKYSEIELNPFNRQKRTSIKAIGFASVRSLGGATKAVQISKIDIYKFGTNYGPVRGQMIAMPLGINVEVRAGDLVEINSSGCLKQASASSPSFQGQVVRNQVYGFDSYNYGYSHGPEKYVYVVRDGVINIPFDAGAITQGNGVKITGTTTVGKTGATEPHLQIGVAMKSVGSQGGVYPLLIGRNGYTGTF